MAGAQALGSAPAASQSHRQGAGSEVELPGLELQLTCTTGVKGSGLTHYTTTLASQPTIVKATSWHSILLTYYFGEIKKIIMP